MAFLGQEMEMARANTGSYWRWTSPATSISPRFPHRITMFPICWLTGLFIFVSLFCMHTLFLLPLKILHGAYLSQLRNHAREPDLECPQPFRSRSQGWDLEADFQKPGQEGWSGRFSVCLESQDGLLARTDPQGLGGSSKAPPRCWAREAGRGGGGGGGGQPLSRPRPGTAH